MQQNAYQSSNRNKQNNNYEQRDGPRNSSIDWKQNVVCWNCQKLGHIARECRFRSRRSNQSNMQEN